MNPTVVEYRGDYRWNQAFSRHTVSEPMKRAYPVIAVGCWAMNAARHDG